MDMLFIGAHRGELRIELVCRELAIAPSSYHEHTALLADPSRRPARMLPIGDIGAHPSNFGHLGIRDTTARQVQMTDISQLCSRAVP